MPDAFNGGESSPLDSEPAVRTKAPRKPRKAVTVEFPDDAEPDVARSSSAPKDSVDGGSYEDDSPLDADAEAEVSMVEVERTGPGQGPGWVGRRFHHQGEHEPRDVSYGRVGSFPRTQDVYERVQQAAGGGTYRFVTKGKKPVFKTLVGIPLPLPGSEEQEPSGQPGFEYGPPIDERGFGTDFRGTDFRGTDFRGTDFRGRDRFRYQDPYAPDPQTGTVPPLEDVTAASGLTGWVWLHALNGWKWFGPGVQPRTPPPMPGANVASQQFNPDFFDNSRRRGEEKDERVEALAKTVEKILDKLDRPATDPMAGLASMIQAQMQADAARYDRQAVAEREARIEREKESQRRHEADQAERQRQFDLMLARLEKDSTAAAARKSDEVEIAKINASAAKDTAALAAASAKEVANAHAAANQQIIALALQKGDSMTTFKEGISMATELVGGKANDSVVAQTAEAIERAVPAVAQAVTDGIYAYKGYPIPIRNGQPGQVPMNQPPQIGMTNPPANGQPAGQAAPQGDIPTAQETVQSLQLVHFLVESWKNGEKPLRSVVRHGCRAYGVQNVTGTINMLLMATPEIVLAKFEQGVNALQGQAPFPAMLADVKAMAGSQQGRAWFQALQEEVRQGQVAMAQGQQTSAPAPAAGQEATKS